MNVHERLITMLLALNSGTSVWALCKFMTPGDFSRPSKIKPFLVIMLDCTRWEATRAAGHAVKLIVTDDWRENDDLTHGEGLGVDVRSKKARNRHWLLNAATVVGITRIGVYCDDLHLHFDVGGYFDSGLDLAFAPIPFLPLPASPFPFPALK